MQSIRSYKVSNQYNKLTIKITFLNNFFGVYFYIIDIKVIYFYLKY